ncbi:hypothetical protein PQO03_05190 [Lentisphaera profundi]|uniref:Metallopeptidase n=1 Tax=Lentisphaera profundi TaxID=1658616 RepID=A0ABY7VVV2_9BACT|nr:hypothetical protein [Lentisphaera profundi]WDE97345.1 hypothetical protein PQO03_05190 [Lentisphaera profundi]
MRKSSIILMIFFISQLNLFAADYRKEKILSWEVYLQKTDDETKKVTIKKAFEQLKIDLAQIEKLVPKKHLGKLKKVKIWISFNSQPGAAYHPSERWLRENGRYPKMAKAIEIQNAQNYIDWLQYQPMIILHELSHAYHHQVLSYNHKGILSAYNNAKNTGIYDSVNYISGGKKRAYAMNNEKEYFAELTEAYFGKNDFFPFIKSELKKHDPKGYALIHKIWN